MSVIDHALQLEVERFLYREAMLLDEWRLQEWLALFSPQARYIVPSTDHPQGNPPEHPALIDDDFNRLQGRVTRLLSRRAHREYPSSRTRHLVSNILITDSNATDLSVSAAFVVYRLRNRDVTQYIGRYLYVFQRDGSNLKICLKRVELDLEGLWEQGTVSILL
jgi:p-cumate 2,3-dioxygenase beta subunit